MISDETDALHVRPGAASSEGLFGLAVVLLLVLAAIHFLVDLFASTISPLWPSLERTYQLNDLGGTLLFLLWSIATSFSQLFFGAISDRNHYRWLIWAGPAVALICLSCLGLVANGLLAGLLVLIAGLGVAAFHPEAATLAGSLLPGRRSRAMAVFALSGYLGQAVGPRYSGALVERYGLASLCWSLAWGGPVLCLLAASVIFASRARLKAEAVVAQPKTSGRPSIRICLLLLSIGSLRVVPALGVPYSLAYLLDNVGQKVLGNVQSGYMAGIGCGAVGCAVLVRRKWERTVLAVFPVCAAPILLSIPGRPDSWLPLLVFLSGLLLGITMPVYISYGQQLIPQSQRVASSITMGVSWGVGGALVAAASACFRYLDALPWMFTLFAATCVASSVLCYWLPVVGHESTDSSRTP